MSKQDTENLDSGDESDHDLISTGMLEKICDGSQTHLKINKKNHVIKFMTLLGKGNWNVKER